MEVFAGRRTASGQWVTWGPASELAAVCASGETVEVVTPSRAVARVRITRVGHAWTVAGVRVAYGYIEDAPEDGAA